MPVVGEPSPNATTVKPRDDNEMVKVKSASSQEIPAATADMPMQSTDELATMRSTSEQVSRDIKAAVMSTATPNNASAVPTANERPPEPSAALAPEGKSATEHAPPKPARPLDYTVENMYPVKWEDAAPPTLQASNTTVKTTKSTKKALKAAQKSFKSATLPADVAKPSLELQLHALRESSSAEIAKLKVQLQLLTSERDAGHSRFNRVGSTLHHALILYFLDDDGAQ